MPRHRRRKTNRKVQEERILRVRGVRRGTPDPRKLSRAFIGLALARAEAEAQAQADEARQEESREAKRKDPHGDNDTENQDGSLQ